MHTQFIGKALFLGVSLRSYGEKKSINEKNSKESAFAAMLAGIIQSVKDSCRTKEKMCWLIPVYFIIYPLHLLFSPTLL